MLVEGGILLNACISAVASVLAIYTIWYKILPAIDGYVQARRRLETAIIKAEDTIPEIRESLSTAMEKIDQAVEEFKIIQEGLLTVQGPEGPVIVPMSEQIRMAGESMLMSLGGAYLSEKPSKEELASHEFKLKGISSFGYKFGLGVRKGVNLDKYDPLIARFAGGGGAQAGAGGGDMDIMSIANSFVPQEFQGFLGGFLGNGGDGNASQGAPKEGNSQKIYGQV